MNVEIILSWYKNKALRDQISSILRTGRRFHAAQMTHNVS
jgi:hypothetical protein